MHLGTPSLISVGRDSKCPQVAIEAGNSENIIFKNHRELVTEEKQMRGSQSFN